MMTDTMLSFQRMFTLQPGLKYLNLHCHSFLNSYSVCIGQVEDRKFLRKLSLQCLVLDEGHMLKNMATQRYGHLMKIKVQCHLGTFVRVEYEYASDIVLLV